MTFQEITESLYGLTREELRRLAWEALLISDGPNKVQSEDDVAPFEDEDSCFYVTQIAPVPNDRNLPIGPGFAIRGKKGWES